MERVGYLISVVLSCNLFQTNYKVTAFATAEQYHLESLANEAQQYGYTVMQLPEGA